MPESQNKGSKVIRVITARPHRPEIDGARWAALDDEATRQGVTATTLLRRAIDQLLGQEGKVVSTNAHGEMLEKEVKRLLNL